MRITCIRQRHRPDSRAERADERFAWGADELQPISKRETRSARSGAVKPRGSFYSALVLGLKVSFLRLGGVFFVWGRISCVAFRVACVGLPRHVSQKRHILHGISHARGFAGGGGEEASWGGVGS